MKVNSHIFIIFFLVAVPGSLWTQDTRPTLTVDQALKRGLASLHLQAVFDNRLAAAESEIVGQRTWDNPELLVSSEHNEEDGIHSRENYLTVSQRVTLFGIQKLRAQAAEHEKEAVRLENQLQRIDTAALIKETFYEVLYYQERIKILQDWDTKTQAIVGSMNLRDKAGQVSGYDRRQLQRERSDARILITMDRGYHAGKWEQLRNLLGLDENHVLSGTLLPPLSKENQPLSQHPELLLHERNIHAANLQEKAASHWKLPEITVEAGLKNTHVLGEKSEGFLIAATLPIPVFNRNKSELMQARAKARIARNEKALTQSRIQGQIGALRKQVQFLRQATEQFRGESLEISWEMVVIAQQAYDEGELEILDLLGAHGALRDAQLEVLSMAAETRTLIIELERLEGKQ